MSDPGLKEQVLVVDYDYIFPKKKEHGSLRIYGLIAWPEDEERKDKLSLRPRDEVETDQSVLQIIPTVALVCEDSVLVYRRGTSGGESRLHNKYAIMIGGHINAQDYNPEKGLRGAIINCLEREIMEEIKGLDLSNVLLQFGDIIYTDDAPVSSVHLGLLYLIQVQDKNLISSNEDALQDLQWVPVKHLVSDKWKEKLESWALLSLPAINKVLENNNAV